MAVPVGAAIGGLNAVTGIASGVMGAMDTSAEDAQRQIKRDVREGIYQGQSLAAGMAAQALAEPEMIAYRNQVRALYGLDPIGSGDVSMQNPLEMGGRYYLAEPMAGAKSWKKAGSGARGDVKAVVGDIEKVAEAQRLQGLENLSEKDQRLVAEALSDENLANLYRDLSKLDDQQANLLAERLQRKYGVSADTFQSVYGAAQKAAGVTPTETKPGEAPGYLTLDAEYQRQLQMSMASRGITTGVGPASAEAAGLAAYNQNLRLQNLPNLMQAGMLPTQLYQGALNTTLPMEVQRLTGGMHAYGQVNPMAGVVPQGSLARVGEGINAGMAAINRGMAVYNSFPGAQAAGAPAVGTQQVMTLAQMQGFPTM